MLASTTASAQSLSGPVTGWNKGDLQPEPTQDVSMFEYVPTTLAASPPVLVAAHFCGGSASAMFGYTCNVGTTCTSGEASTAGGMPAIEQAAKQYGFIIVFPQTTNPATSAKCWDVGSPQSLTHGGGGDTQAIVEMVQYEVSTRGADPNRVYAMGVSSGAMLTEALMGVYPDVFKAGAEFSGVPAGCWSDGWTAASNWSNACAGGQNTMTAAKWGTLVAGMFPGYTGPRPRLQLWHGPNDALVNFNNQTQAILEWTNVLGLSATPNSTDTTSMPSYTIQKWQNSCGFTVLEAHEDMESDNGHTTPIYASSVINFFGLNKTGPDPGLTACDGGTSGGSSSSSSTGSTSTGAGSTTAGGGSSTGSATTRGGSSSSQSGTGAGSGSAASGGNGGSASAGSAGGSTAGGSVDGGSGSASPASSGCSCNVPASRGSTTATALLAAGLLGGLLRGRRRRRG
jgi:poly(hydroxyalkanoate) depolymerase family esterase